MPTPRTRSAPGGGGGDRLGIDGCGWCVRACVVCACVRVLERGGGGGGGFDRLEINDCLLAGENVCACVRACVGALFSSMMIMNVILLIVLFNECVPLCFCMPQALLESGAYVPDSFDTLGTMIT